MLGLNNFWVVTIRNRLKLESLHKSLCVIKPVGYCDQFWTMLDENF